jgi:hypothetical protein
VPLLIFVVRLAAAAMMIVSACGTGWLIATIVSERRRMRNSQAEDRPCSCDSCRLTRYGWYANTCCPSGLTHGALCICGGSSIQQARKI